MAREYERDKQWDFKVDKGESGIHALAYLYLDEKTVAVGQNYRGHKGTIPLPGNETDFSWYVGDKEIPPTVKNGKKDYTVTKIAKWAFMSAARVRKITLPPSIVEIEDEAFKCCGGANIIHLNEGLKRIGNSALFFCNNLNEITIPDSVTVIGSQAFMSCGYMTSATIGSGITKMDQTFLGCKNLKTITCRAINPPIITEETFSHETYQSANLYVPYNSVQSYKKAANWKNFKHIYALPYDFEKDCLFYIIKDKNTVGVVAGENRGRYGSYGSIPDTVTRISYGYKDNKLVEYANTYRVTSIEALAFADCYDLTEVVLGDNITNVGYKAFANCPNLTNVLYTTNVPTADSTVFQNSPKAQFVQKKLSKGSCFCIDGIFYQIEEVEREYQVSVTYDKLSKPGSGIQYKGHVVIPDTVIYAGKTFKVVYIDSLAFSKCNELTAVTLPQKMWVIRKRAFWEAKKLKSMTFGSNVCSIEGDAFASCENLAEIKFLDGMLNGKREKRILSIDAGAFANCKNLMEIYCGRMTPPEIKNKNAFDQHTIDDAIVHVNDCDKDAYQKDPIWQQFNRVADL